VNLILGNTEDSGDISLCYTQVVSDLNLCYIEDSKTVITVEISADC